VIDNPEASANHLVRIAVFYDGNYFSHVSNYYNYEHPRRARIDFKGLHAFVRHEVAQQEGVDPRYCHVVEAHFFRGRKPTRDANLIAERQFDDVLMRAGITTHYTPLTRRGEKGIDVWLALEAFELVILKKYNVVTLIAGDSDYVPLMRKLATFGARVLLLGWNFKTVGPDREERETRIAQSLFDEATYPVLMSEVIDDPGRAGDPLIDALFLKRAPVNVPFEELPGEAPEDAVDEGSVIDVSMDATETGEPVAEYRRGTVKFAKDGWGFIVDEETQSDVFFHWTDVEGLDFNELHDGVSVAYIPGMNDRGRCARHVVST